MVLSAHRMLQMSKIEEISYMLISSVDIKEHVKLNAVYVLQHIFKLKKTSEKKYSNAISKMNRK
jgi:hypothetical protein